MRSIKSQIAFQEDYLRHLGPHLEARVAANAMTRGVADAKLDCAESILFTLRKVLDLHPHQEARHG